MAPNFEPWQGLRPLFLFLLLGVLSFFSSRSFADGSVWKVQDTPNVQGVWACNQEDACNRAIGISGNSVPYSCPGFTGTRQDHYQLAWEAGQCNLYRIREQCGTSGGGVNVGAQGLDQQAYTGDCPYADEEPTCTQGETFSGQISDISDVCNGGCVATPDSRPAGAIGYGLSMSDGSPLPGWYGSYTYTGGECTVEPAAPPQENCLTDSSGNQYCYEAQDQNCGTVNGEAVCVGEPDGCGTFNGVSLCPDDLGCYDMPSGSRVCPDGVGAPPAPDDGTPGQAAGPDGEITDGDGNTYNYFDAGTVDGSSDSGEECPPGESCEGEGEEECPEGEECDSWDGSGQMDDVDGPGSKLDEARTELSNKVAQIRNEAASMIGLWDASGEATLPSGSAETSLGTVSISIQDIGGWVGLVRGILFFAVALGCFFIILENGFGDKK